MFEIERVVNELGDISRRLEPECCSGADAARLTEIAALGERFIVHIKAMYPQRGAGARRPPGAAAGAYGIGGGL